ncbi:MAG: gliding motility protein [Cytophagaceae bacterium]|nr:gliding motility protein [Cytophagaceae bacterium]
MKTQLIACLLAGFVAFFAACQSDSDSRQSTQLPGAAPGADTIKINVRIERIESQLFTAQSPAEVETFLRKNASVRAAYFPQDAFGPNAQLAKTLTELVKNPGLRDFYQDGQKQFADLSDLQRGFEEAFQNLKAYYPAFKEPRIVTLFTGFTGPDLYVSDSLIVIGLDYFMGPKARYRPQLENYQLRKYQREYIAPQVLLLLSGKYNETNLQDQTLLAEMVYYGKSFEFVKNVVPSISDSLIIDYSGTQLAANEVAQDLIWAHFIDEKLLYETSPLRKAKYVGERPTTVEIGPKCPGRIGQWLGWKLVRKYLEAQPNVTLQQLMKTTDAPRILTESKYRGQVGQTQ